MFLINRREMLALAAWSVAASRAWADAPMHAQERELYEAAKREGEITWYSGQYNADSAEAAGRAFNARYPGVRCNVVRSTSQVAFQRLSQDQRAGVAQCDVFSSTNGGHYIQLKRQNRLTQFRPVNADGLLPILRIADPDNYFQSSFLGVFLIGHNTTMVSEADAPRSWADILDPKWRNKLAVGHPGFSGAIGVWALQMRTMLGPDFLRRLEANKPQVGRSSIDPVTMMNAGERPIGVAVSANSTLLAASRGNPLRLIYPSEGVVAAISPSAILANAPHPNAAKLFMEFQTGPGLSAAVREIFNESIRPDVPPPVGSRPLSETTMLAPSLEEAERGVPEVREQWRDIFGI
ncbi:extracellular solute-binding protein [Roseomonas terrae]|uniref:Extracellular solute-binding protein n=1 Tax=Neoroseomonas terrae TaxID=424799 RepID=A0ABS5EBN6_9PROT|nr:extracellular solute-binding protein [Neoroseomonas terrae]